MRTIKTGYLIFLSQNEIKGIYKNDKVMPRNHGDKNSVSDGDYHIEFRFGKYKKLYPLTKTGESCFMISNFDHVKKVMHQCENVTNYYNAFSKMYAKEFPDLQNPEIGNASFHYQKTINKLLDRLKEPCSKPSLASNTVETLQSCQALLKNKPFMQKCTKISEVR